MQRGGCIISVWPFGGDDCRARRRLGSVSVNLRARGKEIDAAAVRRDNMMQAYKDI